MKGHVAESLARHPVLPHLRKVAVRVGGPNAGHSFIDANGKLQKVQSIPVASFVNAAWEPVIGASGVIIPSLLAEELELLDRVWGERGITPPRLLIDPNATVITPQHMEAETGLKTAIGSTGEGVGAATAQKIWRKAPTFADWLYKEYDIPDYPNQDTRAAILGRGVAITDTVRLIGLNDIEAMIEGTQGYMLSLNVSGYYPFTTSRDCGPEALMSQVGTNPRKWDKVRLISVFRTFPIRVGGNSGDLPHEIDWETLEKETGGYVNTPEITTVTKKVRRIARWSDRIARRTVRETGPTEIALTFMDYLYPEVAKLADGPGDYTEDYLSQQHPAWQALEDKVLEFEDRLDILITFVSFGQGRYVRRYQDKWGD